MKLSNYTLPEKIVYSETLAKFLLSESIINSVLKQFKTKDRDNWKEYPCTEDCTSGTKLCKRHKVLNHVLEAESFAIFNTDEYSSENVDGPYMNKYYICWYNKKDELLLVINTPSITPKNEYESENDVSIKKLNVFIFGGIKDPNFGESVLQTIDIKDLKDQKALTTKYSKGDDKILKIIKIYDTYVWEIINKHSQPEHYDEVCYYPE